MITVPRHIVIENLSIRRTARYSMQYINTAVTSASHSQSDIRISFGCTDMHKNEVKVLQYLGESFVEVCQEEFHDKVNQCLWIPGHPQLLAIATKEMSIYEYRNNELSLRGSLLPSGKPVIFMDWNRCYPQTALATRKDGQLILMNLEYYRPDGRMLVSNQWSFLHLPAPSCGARFGTRDMKKCVITAHKFNQVQILNEEFRVINDYRFTNDILGIEFSTHSEHVAFRMRNKVCVYDLRNLNIELNTYSPSSVNELLTCFCWSPRFPALYIGTSEGKIIKWWFNSNRAYDDCRNVMQRKIPNIHLAETMDNLFFATSVDLPYEPYATSVEAYLCVPSL